MATGERIVGIERRDERQEFLGGLDGRGACWPAFAAATRSSSVPTLRELRAVRNREGA